MLFDTDKLFTMSQANLNFSKVAGEAKRSGKALILKHNKPAFLVLAIDDLTDNDKKMLDRIIDSRLKTKKRKEILNE